MRFLRDLLDKMIGFFFPRTQKLNMQVADAIDLRDLFTEDLRGTEQDVGAMPDDFKIFSSKDDYNREFLYVFQTFKGSFFLDYNHRDGHFRV
jgi:hypothetical protein